MQYVRGRLDMNRYINQNLSRGRWHKLNCVYDPFVLDNRFNQIIKYVTTILINQTESDDSKKYLREILFTLDDVSDVPATADECAAIQFNPAFAEFETVGITVSFSESRRLLRLQERSEALRFPATDGVPV